MILRHALRSILPASALTLLALGAFAQPGKTRVVLYKDRLAAQFDTVDCVKNAFKINPLLFFRGEIPLYYERALTPKLSLEIGLGVTLRNYLALSFAGDDADADEFGAGTEIIPNLSYRMGARWYFQDDLEPIGNYLQIEHAHQMYTKDIRAKGNDGKFIDQTFRDERTYNDVRLLYGYQMLGSSTNWLFDIYGGVGFRARNQVIVKEIHTITPDPDVPDTFEYAVEEKSDNVPAFFLGMKLGLGF
ncbi:MAG: hypothetical protein IPL52_14700 [Flavobacteriales bacterium]|nr:hypothetical protein [Flavobacteriales bacterium]